MRTLTTLVFATTCFITSSGYALVSCPPGSTNPDTKTASTCVLIQGDSKAHYVQQKIVGFSQTATECVAPGEDLFIDNADVPDAISAGMLHLGGNTFKYFQCSDQSCTKKILIDTYRFTLSEQPSSIYNAAPDHHTITLVNNDDATCTPDLSPKKYAFLK
ncbi:MAG: hypothetical protein NTZ67_02770 [Gammaproteobacteria bacterium]|nr:hypothetical protein [Gammaproteobacteria bacterium]